MLDASILKRKPRTARQIELAMRPKESSIQGNFIIWLHYEEKFHPALQLGFAVPNGGYRSPTTAKKMQREGQRPGVPDFVLPVARNGFIGLALEFKRPGGKQSDVQIAYMHKLVAEKWQYHVVDDFADAITITKQYLGIQ